MENYIFDPITENELDDLFPSLIYRMKKENIELNNKNIRTFLYSYVISELYSDNRFAYHEKIFEGTKTGCFIRGHVLDIFDYLEKAYVLIHETDYTKQIQQVKEE